MTNTVRIAGAALNQTPIDWQNNKNHIIEAIQQAKSQHIDILCLPELCITGYGCEDLFLSDWVPEKSKDILAEIIQYCDDIAVAIGLPIKYEGILYNTTCFVHNKKILGLYAKQNMANDGVHYEPRWFTPWPSDKVVEINIAGQDVLLGDIILDFNDIKIGFEICEDAWRMERPACKSYKKGVQLIINPSASHFAFGKSHTRNSLVVDSSRTFKCYYLYANLLGNEAGRMIFDGEILIAGHGKLLAYNDLLSFKDVNIKYADINPLELPQKGIDRPKENKADIFAQSASLALYDYMRKSRSNGFVLSLSGGADSSTCAIMVAEMVRRGRKEIGAAFFKKIEYLPFPLSVKEDNNVVLTKLLTTAYQGTVNSSDSTFNSAKELASEIGAVFHHWLIDDEVASYTNKVENAISRTLNWDHDDITLQNIQARARSPIIWMLANINNALLLTTSNRSEGDVGYATMDGDTSGSLAPISAVDKHFILQFLKYAEDQLGYQSLRHVNSLAPSAELRPLEKSQTDETDLMPYPVIVEIEKLAIKNKKSPIQVFSILKQQSLENEALLKLHIRRFFLLWSRNQWKRERLAPAFHLDDFNVDPRTWCRFPILSGSFHEELEDLANA